MEKNKPSPMPGNDAAGTLQRTAESDTTMPITGAAGGSVQYICKLDREIYKCVSGDITTNDVVLTAERIRHIKEHHPEDYERYHEYIRMMIETSDYILETRAPDSAFIVNEFAKGEEHFRMILKLKTPREEKNYLNSVIQFQYINAREYRRLIKNKKILYKRHDL